MGEFDLLFFDMHILFYENENRYKDKGELGKSLFAFTCFFSYYQVLNC
jgi:hypothetical protein